MKKLVAFVVVLLTVSVWCAPTAHSQDVSGMAAELASLERQMPQKQAEMQFVEKQNQENIDKDQQLKRDAGRSDREVPALNAEREKLRSALTNWSNARFALQSEGCAGRTTDRAFYDACQRKIAAVNAEHDRLEGEIVRVKTATEKHQAEVERINRERQTLNDSVLRQTAAYKRVVGEWNDLVDRIKILRIALRDRCQALLRGGGSVDSDIRRQALKHCGNVTFDGADPNLKPLIR
jgi:chromosome segregation ATPase